MKANPLQFVFDPEQVQDSFHPTNKLSPPQDDEIVTDNNFKIDENDNHNNHTTDDEEEGSISPSSLLTIYESGFNYLYGSVVSVNGKKTDMIKLFPEGGGKPYHTIKIYVDQASSQITRIEVFGKDGNTFTYDLKTIKSNQEMNDSMFVFDTSKAGDVVDLRD